MARAKTLEQSRSRTKAATIEELTRGVGKLQGFLAQVEDLGQEGFPYLDAARARTELQFRECIRRTFGEKSQEFQTHRHHRLLMDRPEDTQQSIALIKTLIATLEQKKLDLQGGAPQNSSPTPVATSPPLARPPMAPVPPSISTIHLTTTQPLPITPPPTTTADAMTTNLALSSAAAAPSPPPPPPAPACATEAAESKPILATFPPEPSPLSPAQTITGISYLPPQPVTRQAPAPAPLHLPPQAPAAPAHAARFPQPPRHEPVAIEPPVLSTGAPDHMQELSPVPINLQTHPMMPIGSSSHQKPTPQSPQAGSDPLELVKTLCCRFHTVARQLRLRGDYRATLSVEDEFDAQDLLHALLRIQFDDIGTDEWTPSYAGGSARTAFMLQDGRLAVIVKKTRPGLNANDFTEQLRIDVDRYRSYDRCTTLLCFMYDPEGRIGNPRGLETHLSSVSETFSIHILVAPK